VFAIALTLSALLATTAVLYIAVLRLSRAGYGLRLQQFEPLLRATEEIEHVSAEVAAKVNQRTKGQH